MEGTQFACLNIVLGTLRGKSFLFITVGCFQTGWMMWNWLVSALAAGSSVVLYDGSPFVPTPNVLWDLVDEIG